MKLQLKKVACWIGFGLCILSMRAQSPDRVVLRGTVVEPVEPIVSLEDASVFPPVSDPLTAEISGEGDFWLEWAIDRPQLARLIHGTQEVLLLVHPGDVIDLKSRGDRFEGQTTLEGTSQGVLDSRALQQYLEGMGGIGQLDPSLAGSLPAYTRKLEKFEQQALQNWDAQRDTSLHSQTLIALLDSWPYYLKNARLLKAPAHFALRNGQNPADLQLPTNLIPPPSPSQLNRIDLIQFPAYQEFLEAYFEYQLLLQHLPTQMEEESRMEALFAPLFEQLKGEVLTFQTARQIAELLKEGDHKAVTRFYNDFPQLTQAIRYIPHLKALHENYGAIAKGEEAPPFSLTHADGSTHRLSDHLGKVVYLFFWEKGMENEAEQLEKIADLSRKLDRDGGVVWALGVGPESQLAESGFLISSNLPEVPNPLLEKYKVSNLPRGIMINRDGSIAEPSAPLPIQGKVLEEVLKRTLVRTE